MYGAFYPCIYPEVLKGVRRWLEAWRTAFEELVRKESVNVQRALRISENGYRVEYFIRAWIESDDPLHTIVVFRVFPARNSFESGVHWVGEGAKILYKEEPLYDMALNILQFCSDHKSYVDPEKAAEEALSYLKMKMRLAQEISEQIRRLKEELSSLIVTLVIASFFVNVAANFFMVGDLWNAIVSLLVSILVIAVYVTLKTFRRTSQ